MQYGIRGTSSPFRVSIRVSAWEEPFLTQKTEPVFLPGCILLSWGKGSHPRKPSLIPGWPSQKVTLLSNTWKIFRVNRRLSAGIDGMKAWNGYSGWLSRLLEARHTYTPLCHTVSISESSLMSQLSHSSRPLISDHQAFFWSLPLLVISLCTSQEKPSAFQGNLIQRREGLHTHACWPRPRVNYFIVLSFWKECQDV